MSLGGTILATHRDTFVERFKEAIVRPALRAEEFERVRREMLSEIELMSDEDNYLRGTGYVKRCSATAHSRTMLWVRFRV